MEDVYDPTDDVDTDEYGWEDTEGNLQDLLYLLRCEEEGCDFRKQTNFPATRNLHRRIHANQHGHQNFWEAEIQHVRTKEEQIHGHAKEKQMLVHDLQETLDELRQETDVFGLSDWQLISMWIPMYPVEERYYFPRGSRLVGVHLNDENNVSLTVMQASEELPPEEHVLGSVVSPGRPTLPANTTYIGSVNFPLPDGKWSGMGNRPYRTIHYLDTIVRGDEK